MLVNVNQMIAFMGLLAVPFPANTYPLFRFLQFLNGDIFVLEKAYSYSIGLLFPPASTPPFNSRFELLGASSLTLRH